MTTLRSASGYQNLKIRKGRRKVWICDYLLGTQPRLRNAEPRVSLELHRNSRWGS